jgi:hypothetical protein
VLVKVNGLPVWQSFGGVQVTDRVIDEDVGVVLWKVVRRRLWLEWHMKEIIWALYVNLITDCVSHLTSPLHWGVCKQSHLPASLSKLVNLGSILLKLGA